MDHKEKAAEIKLFILDVDGVLTDGRIVINDLGQEIKTFDAKDGYGLVRLIKAGIDVIIISGRKSRAVEYRAENLGIQEVYQGVNDKKTLYHDLLKQKGILKNQACCIGDDIPDIPMLRDAGLSVAVADAVKEVREMADYVTKKKGGNGAVREVCELILKSRSLWN